MNLRLKPAALHASEASQAEWVLARARSMRAGLRLVQLEIDEIGISLKNGWITAQQAASDLALLEQLPVYVASIFLGQTE